MPQPNQDQASGVDVTHILPDDVVQNVLSHHLPNSDVLSMYQTSKKLNGFFQVQMSTLKTLKHVVEGDVDGLMLLIKENPGLLFKKGNVKAPRGQTYYDVSPYMLMKFLCDEDMLTHIMPLIPERFKQVRQAQDTELGCGGSDLVKLDFDPMLVIGDDFNKIINFKTHINVQGTPTEITFSLLENPDGILYWKDAQGNVNFYYANRETQTVIPIIPVATTPEEHKALEALNHSFDEMENNSACRSTNKEHQLIAKLMQRTLHRQGICYSDAHEEHYCDSHTPFQLINRYRKSIRLYEEAVDDDERNRAHQYWREGVGRAQGEEMWLLQRICEENRPFHPLPECFDELKRGFILFNLRAGQNESVFNNGRLVAGLGSEFAIYKACGMAIIMPWAAGFGIIDLISVCWLVEYAKTKTIGFASESDPIVQPTIGSQR